ncbi:FmdB family zinc ribbon protein [Limnohabitans sp. Rim8]|uniref:FmdB family zinc ribbon protein n=1 Tax=Limnohabitans sp. Rim8 TaxID=1100718 RepID=UPI002636B085|nr:FmdB family zinc ribbon protein [Limnohabitans sp. Rim8]
MPIYAYKCESCGHAKDVLQKMADEPLTDCPVCSKPSYKKQLTAAGFQLKGNGWYATDFKGGSGGATAPQVSTEGGGDAAPSTPGTPATPATPASTDSPPSASGSGSAAASCAPSCACH